MNINELNVSKLSLMQVNIGTVELILVSTQVSFHYSVLVHSPCAASELVLLSFTNKKFHCFSCEVRSR